MHTTICLLLALGSASQAEVAKDVNARSPKPETESAKSVAPAAKNVKGPPPKYEVHEWSVWTVDLSTGRLNAKEACPNSLPAFVDSSRNREKAITDNIAPLTVMTFYGAPVVELEVELQLKSTSALAHWPKGEVKNRRLKWTGVSLSPTCADESRLAYFGDGHWLKSLRELAGAQYVTMGTRTDRLIAYDLESSLTAPVKVEGGPDKFKVANQSNQKIHDVVLSVPSKEGRRIAWFDSLMPAKTGGRPAGAPSAPTPGPTPGRMATDAIAAPGGMVMRRSVRGAARPANQPQPAAPPAAAGPPVEATLSNPLKAGTPEREAKTAGELRARLVRAGLNPRESELATAQVVKTLFDSEDFMVALRLDPAFLDEMLPQDFFPEPAKRVRVAFLVIRGMDPRLGSEITQLVAQLGNAKFEVRETAETKLKKIGAPAFAALKEALKHTDLEVVYRAERILGPGQAGQPGQQN